MIKFTQRKKKTPLLVTISIVTVLIIMILLFIFVWGDLTKPNIANNDEEPLFSSSMFSQEGYEAFLAENVSDIKGLSKLDKYKMGLNPDEQSDTDGDGLTDKEEIEKYSSDPLKRSTAGDLYTDAYKVENNMDVNTYYEYDKPIEFKYNKCPEVQLTASVEDDLWAVCELYSINLVDGYDVLGSYNIYNYEGLVSIDVSNYISSEITVGDIVVLQSEWSGRNLKQLNTSNDGNIINIIEPIKREDLIISIAKKSPKKSNFNATNNSDDNELSSTGDGIVYTW
ncbi:MAG: hypothetical protein Q4B53_05150, partial [Lachnospiraceae bacterium]|nr:hypothetical protein [Lachnospiraceae bacterium]